MNTIHTYNSESTFQQAVATSIRSRILKKNREGTMFRLAVSGGSTPGPIYNIIATYNDIDWKLVEVFLVDERYVPYNHEHSNHQLVDNTLLKKIPSKPRRTVFFDTKLSVEEALKKYDAELNPNIEPYFDLILLGMGMDGHTASLFPHDVLLSDNKHWVGSSKNGDPIPERLTLTFPALESSREIFFLLKGQQKQMILEKVQQAKANDQNLPAARLFHRENTQVFYAEV